MDSGRAIIAAEETFQRGEVLLKKGDHAKALEAFAQAMKANPLEPAYKAYWAWTRFDSPDAPKDRLVRDTLKVLEEVLRDRSKFPVAHYWIGLLLQAPRRQHERRERLPHRRRPGQGPARGRTRAAPHGDAPHPRRHHPAHRRPPLRHRHRRPQGPGGLLNKILKR